MSRPTYKRSDTFTNHHLRTNRGATLTKHNTEWCRELYAELTAGTVNDFFWTHHAIDRAQELVKAGFPMQVILGALRSPDEVLWSSRYESPRCVRGGVAVALVADRAGRAIVTSVLPSTEEGWERLYRSGAAGVGRERREVMFVSKLDRGGLG